jgi:23S rRNA (cytidine1920-2'-O)/16S rRNA (cytidine1409-2'-O)-methyltransferase
MEGTNARFVEQLPELVTFITIDASFISLKNLLPVVRKWLDDEGDVLALIKPQFEAGRKEVARGKGVVRDPAVHKKVLLDVLTFAQVEGYQIEGLARSPVLGPKGNVEFLAWLSYPGEAAPSEISAEEHVFGIIDVE